MLVDDLQSQGIKLSINGEMLAYDCEDYITEQLIDVLKNNKQRLIAELLVRAQIEVMDGDDFPRHRFKGEHMPKPRATDFEWLSEQLSYSNDRLGAAAEYSRRYKHAYDSEAIAVKKDNAARRAANSWLRENHT